MWCWRRMEKIIWTDCVRYEEILSGVKEERNILHTVTETKANLIGQISRRNCLLKYITGGKIRGGIYVTRRQWRRCKQLLDDLKKTRLLEFKRRKTKLPCIEKSLWKGLWICCKTDYWMNEFYVQSCAEIKNLLQYLIGKTPICTLIS